MALGPIQYVIFRFEGNKFDGSIVDNLIDVVDRGFIRVIDILFVQKDGEGNVDVVELDDLEDAGGFDRLVNDALSLLSDDDLLALADDMEPNTSEAVMIVEHLWAIGLGNAIVNAGGRVIETGFIPKSVVDEAEAFYLSDRAE
jgi:hypothetical protein